MIGWQQIPDTNVSLSTGSDDYVAKRLLVLILLLFELSACFVSDGGGGGVVLMFIMSTLKFKRRNQH